MILALDLGGTSIKYGLVDKDGSISEQSSIVSNNNDYSVYINDLLNLVNKHKERIEGVAISSPGGILDDGTCVGLTGIPCIFEKNFRKEIEDQTGLKTTVANDASCTVLSELFDTPNMKNVIAVVLGTGIGGGSYINGELVTGFGGVTAEFGVNYQMKEDGSLERIALSTVQLSEKYNSKYNENITTKEIFERYLQGEENAKIEIKEFFRRIATLVLNIESSFHPEKIVFAGGITNEGSFMSELEEAYQYLQQWVEWDLGVEHKLSRFKSEANLPGAAAYWYKLNS